MKAQHEVEVERVVRMALAREMMDKDRSGRAAPKMVFESAKSASIAASALTEPSDEVIDLAPLIIHLDNILVPLDFSETSLKALQYAVPFAKQFGAKLTLLHIVEPPPFASELLYPGTLAPEELATIKKQLEEIRAAWISLEVLVETVVRQCFPFDGILEVAREIPSGLIIITTHGYSGLKHLLMGSTAENIVRKAPCPVRVVREREYDFV